MNTLVTIPRPGGYIPVYAIGLNARITIDGCHYRAVDTSEIGHVFAPDDNPALRQFFTHEQIHSMMKGEQLEIDPYFHNEGRAKTRARHESSRVVDLPQDQMIRCLAYKEYCDGFLRAKEAARITPAKTRISLSDACLDWLLPALEREMPAKKRAGTKTETVSRPSNRQFRRILKRYIDGGYDAMSLVKRCAGSRAAISYHVAEDVRVWEEFARRYADPRKPTMAAVRRDLEGHLFDVNAKRKAEGLRQHLVPTRKVFERIIKSFNAFWVCAQREGQEAARRKFQISFNGVDAQRPGQIVQMDEWTVDLFALLGWSRLVDRLDEEERKAIQKVRLRVIVAIDVATRCIVAMRFTQAAATELAAIDAIEMMVTDKAPLARLSGAASLWPYHLTPECIVMDNGGTFTGAMIRGVMTSLGCDYMFPPAGVPQMRGMIESIFRTFGLQFLHWFEGRSFGSIFERGDYQSGKRVSLSIDQLNLLFVQAIVDIYHHQPHSGLGNETPHNAWMRLSRQFGVLPPPPKHIRRHIFGTTVERTITDTGIVGLGINYQSEALQDIRLKSTRTVKVRFDRFNLCAASIWTGLGWLTVNASEAIPEDLSIWEWVEANRQVAAENGASTERNLSLMLAAVNRMRLAGDAATARANLATQPVDPEKLNSLQKQFFENVTLRDDLEQRNPTLVPIVFAEDPLRHGIVGIDDEIIVVKEDKAEGSASPIKTPTTTVVKSSSDIVF